MFAGNCPGQGRSRVEGEVMETGRAWLAGMIGWRCGEEISGAWSGHSRKTDR